MDVTCARCGKSFRAKRSDAKYCGDACRQQRKRGTKKDSPGGLVGSVMSELESARVLDSYAGQLAVELARQMTIAGATGIASMSKELRTVMADALAAAAPPAGAAADDDEVAKARKARAEKAARAATG